MSTELQPPIPLQWSKGPARGNIFAFAVKASREMTVEEYQHLSLWCSETFGNGGRFPEIGNRWFGVPSMVGTDKAYFAFKSATDMTVFVLAATK